MHSIETVKEALAGIGLSGEVAEDLAGTILAPPPGAFDPRDVDEADDVRLALLGAVIATLRHDRFGFCLKTLLAFIGPRTARLSLFDRGRFWHLRGFAGWRIDHSIYAAVHALNLSLDRLLTLRTKEAFEYIARVFDTFGQLMQHQGLLTDARSEFEMALVYREKAEDEYGTALTLGNLGRLCMELGDFRSALGHLRRDLEIVERTAPGMTRLRAQLLSHLGSCHLSLGQIEEAETKFLESLRIAASDGNRMGMAFAQLGLARALRSSRREQAEARVAEARTCLDQIGPVPGELDGLFHLTNAEIHLQEGRAEESMAEYQAAREALAASTNVSPVELAELLRGYSRAARLCDDRQKAELLLREALQCLDSTAAESLREDIEGELRAESRYAWLLHSAGRFIGQEQIEILLDEAGKSGFRGARKEIAILFSDIRGFTTISEQFEPADLIVFLNDYLAHMTRCVEQSGGMIDKFIGDAVMALFSLPEPRRDDADRAALAALLMRSELNRFNRKMPPGTPRLAAGVGLHYGSVVAGLIGSPQKRSYTVIGDAVNTASRLEGMSSQLGASVLVSGDLRRRFANPDRYLIRPLGRFRPKGRGKAVEVFDLMGEDDGSGHAGRARREIEAAQKAVENFQARRFVDAGRDFSALAGTTETEHHRPGYLRLAAICQECLENPPAADWDLAVTLTEK